MLRDDAVDLIAFRLGNRSDMGSAIIRELQYQQKELEGKPSLPWFLLSEESTAMLMAEDNGRLPVPEDFLRESEEESALWLYTEGAEPGAQWKEIVKASFDRGRSVYTGTGPPKIYAISANYFRILPIPDQDYTVKMIYYRQGKSLSTNIENEWLKYAPGVLIGMTGLALAGSLQNQAALQSFTTELQIANNNLTIANTARQEANRTRHMGERP